MELPYRTRDTSTRCLSMLSANNEGDVDLNEIDTDADSVGTRELQPKCLAHTGDAFNGRREKRLHESHLTQAQWPETDFFKEAQFSADGTTIVTHNDDQCLRTFVVPQDLLDEAKQPHELSAHSVLSSPCPIQSYALYPGFDLTDLSTTITLSALNDLPIRLTNAISDNYVHATYPHINPKTEACIASSSLTFINGGTHFVSGSQGLIAIFDSSRAGSGPISTHRTKPKNPQNAIYSMRDNSKVTALSESQDGYLAAGSLGRVVGLFAKSGSGKCETAFSVASEAREEALNGTNGTGITSLEWSPDGTYLLIAERQSDVVHVYDVRNQCKRVAFLSGRKARTPQKMGITAVPVRNGYEVWAGGTDGYVRMWRNPGALEGELKPEAELNMHDDSVSSAVWHPDGLVLATCSGQRAIIQEKSESDSEGSSGSESEHDHESHQGSDELDSETDSSNSKASSTSSVCVPIHQSRSAKRSNALDNKLKIWSV